MPTVHYNPQRGEESIRLSDGVPRRLRIDLDAMAIAEAAAGKPFTSLLAILSVEIAQTWLFAGLARDAESRGEDWTLEKLQRLATPAETVALVDTLQRAIAHALPDPNGRTRRAEAGDEPKGEHVPWSWETALWLALRLGLKPTEFWSLTLREFELLQDAARHQVEENQHFSATMTANLMNMWRKRGSSAITADLLLGVKPKQQQAETESAEFTSECPDTTGDPIWEKLDRASREAEERRGQQAK